MGRTWAELTSSEVMTVSELDALADSGANECIAKVAGIFVNKTVTSSSDDLLSKTSGIDLTTTGTTALFTVPGGESYSISKVIIVLTALTGFTSVGTLGIGIAAGEDDIFQSTELTGFDATSKQYVFNPDAIVAGANATDVIRLGIDTAFTATTATADIYLYGYDLS